ncbi:hypothetical protein V2J09_016094 [Rumex salicifolius]
MELGLQHFKFEVLHMKQSESISNNATWVQAISNQMRRNGEELEDVRLMEKILRILDPKFKLIVVTIEETKDRSKMMIEQLEGSLQAYEERHEKKQETTEQLLKLRIKNTTRRGKKTEAIKVVLEEVVAEEEVAVVDEAEAGTPVTTTTLKRRRLIKGSKERTSFKHKIQYYNCQKHGHYAAYCWVSKNKKEEKENFAEVKEEENTTLLLVYKDKGGEEQNTWYLDTGDSNHMCGRRDMFVEIDESIKGSVDFGDDSKIYVKGKGGILFRAKDGSYQVISNVYFVPNMTSNILCIGQLLEKGYDIHMKDYNKLFIRNQKGEFIAQVQMTKYKMFPMNIQCDIARPAMVINRGFGIFVLAT